MGVHNLLGSRLQATRGEDHDEEERKKEEVI